MFTVGLLQWWYGTGIRDQFVRATDRIAALYDYFSIDLLARSLFAPFRQISATKVSGSIEVRLRAFIDRLVSRMVGTVMRAILIVVGIIGIIFTTILNVIWVLVWVILPIVPFVGVTLMLAGWVPWQM